MIKVTKFGGSSLADAAQFRKVAAIIRSDKSRRYVVPSAPGKRFKEDVKVTDMLYNCYNSVYMGKDAFEELFAAIQDRFNGIIRELELELSLEREFEAIRMAFMSKCGKDYAASRGEYLNGKILAAYLGYEFVDAAEVIFFDDSGKFDGELTNTAVADRLKDIERAVIPGFYGSMPNDTVKTFSRGGSDITGSIVARAVQADLYENWTDVPGFLMADPRIVKDPAVIKEITYNELRELSYMGATVLHEDAIFPVRNSRIPINIRDTNAPEEPGTMIVDRRVGGIPDTVITGIAGKKGFKVINIEKDMMNTEIGFGRRVLEVLEKFHISFEHFPSGIDTVGVVVRDTELQNKEKEIITKIQEAVRPDRIVVESEMALIAVVGDGMIRQKGTAAKIFNAIANTEVNIRMIDQGSSELNIIIGVDESDFERALDAIYHAFMK